MLLRNSVVVFMFLLAVVSCSDGMHSMGHGDYSDVSFSNNGAKIYFTGTSDGNTAIRAIGGHHHMSMHGGGCVTCHGENREGGTLMWPWFWKTAPALTPDALLGDHQDEGHAHAVYDRQSLKQAIVEGINPAGEPLNDLMPRWQIAEKDLDDLVNFLLDGHTDDNH